MSSNVGAIRLISQGYEPVTKEVFLNEKEAEKAKIKTTFCKIEVDKKTFENFKAIDSKATAVKKDFFLRFKKDLQSEDQKINSLTTQTLGSPKDEKKTVDAIGLIRQGYQSVTKEEYLNEKRAEKAKVKTYYCKVEVDKKTFKKLKAINSKSISTLKSFFIRFNKDLPKENQDVEKEADSSLGNFQKLPIELVSKIILEHMPPAARHGIKTVSKAIHHIVLQGQEEAKKTALQNLELIRPFISKAPSRSSWCFKNNIQTRFFFKEDGHIAALLNNESDFFLKDENKDQLVSKVLDRKILGELYKNNSTLLLYWPSRLFKNPEKGNVDQLAPDCRQLHEIKPTGCVAQVAREMIIEANRLFEGSKKLSVPGKSSWEMVLSDVKNYPTEVILEASNAN